MKIPFKSLEGLRENPKSYWTTKGSPFSGRSKFQRWQDSLRIYHQGGSDLPAAEEYLRGSLGKVKSLRDKELIEFVGQLQQYHNDYSGLDSAFFQFRPNMAFNIKMGYELRGQIPRIDVNLDADGYSAYLFARSAYPWQDELIFPLLQHYLANYFDCNQKDIRVGYYFLEPGKHEAHRFSDTQVDAALEELDELINSIEDNRP